jgi:hypothetical protein
MEPVEQEFDGKKVQRFQYTVKDPNTDQEKYWIVSKRTSEQVDAFLIEGHNLLKIQRLGSGNDTRYNIFPAEIQCLLFIFLGAGQRINQNPNAIVSMFTMYGT